MLNLLKPKAPAAVIRDQLFEAERLMLEHEAGAEHHEALAIMYRARVERLKKINEEKEKSK